MLPWEPHASQVLARYSELADAEPLNETLDALRLLQDKYGCLVIDHEHRPYLGDAALAHLGLPIDRGVKSTIYVAAYPNCLLIMSAYFRDKHNVLGAQVLDDLPQ